MTCGQYSIEKTALHRRLALPFVKYELKGVYKDEDLDPIPSQTVADILAMIRHPIPV
jgi:hypothetical protein